jgi:nicotinate-nucleotide pyrophosphorylase (carboxylating)
MLDSLTARDAFHLIQLALEEDLDRPSLELGIDCTTAALVGNLQTASASFISRKQGVVCGVEVCKIAIENFAPRLSLEVQIPDGQTVRPKQTIATLTGPARDILMIERTCLNFLGRLSGISTLTSQYVSAIEGTMAKVYDTRKTIPGFRRLEKYAVHCGGGWNHRMGLFDAVLIKDNHLAFYASQVPKREIIPRAIEEARKWIDQNWRELSYGMQTVVQLEVDSLEQLRAALDEPCDIILLDNMPIEMLREGVQMRNRKGSQIELEASGGVNLNSIRSIAETGVERISVGALTHSAINFDIGLDWD